MEDKCYGSFSAFINAFYIVWDSWLFSFVAFFRHKAWKGIAPIYVNANYMSPNEWEHELWKRGVDTWIFLPPINGCIWTFYVRKKQHNYANYVIRELAAGRGPKPWNEKRPRRFLDIIGGWF